MKFVDLVTIHCKAGHGGTGIVSFRREIYVPKGGPDGGAGGKGGNVILIAAENKQTLMDLKLRKEYKAKQGLKGKPKNQTGKNGEDCIIYVPCGTIVSHEDTILGDLTQNNEQMVICQGGLGGRGNALMASSKNRAPRHAQPGLPGEELTITLELRLIAQIGLIGLPNAGKSTLLKTLTRANPKIASYPFTTLYPNLGVLKTHDNELIIADIPGLIEGAAEGTGLGFDFLRHISRTQLLIHLISVEEQSETTIFNQFEQVQNELRKSNFDFTQKKGIVILSKIDIIDIKVLNKIHSFFQKKGIKTHSISSFSGEGIQDLIQLIWDEINA